MARRTSNAAAGSITPKGPGKWIVRASLGRDHNGKRLRVHDLVRGTEAGRPAVPHLRKSSSVETTASLAEVGHENPLGEWVKTWLRDHTSTKSPRTRYDYQEHFRRIFEIDPQLGGLELKDLSRARIEAFVSRLQETKKRSQDPVTKKWVETRAALGPRTICMYHGALRAVLNDAVRLDKLTRNVATLIKLPRLQKPDRTAFSAADAERFLQHASDERYFAIFATLLLAGIRPSESLALVWSDIFAGTLRVQRALVWLPGKDSAPIFANTKTDRARTIALGERLVGILLRLRVEQARWRLAIGGSYDSDLNLVFGTELGGPLQLHNVTRAFKQVLRRARLKDMRLYDLRHSHATILHEMGVSVKVIQERLGHSSVQLTLDTYIHVSPGAQEEAAGQLDALLASTKAAGGTR